MSLVLRCIGAIALAWTLAASVAEAANLTIQTATLRAGRLLIVGKGPVGTLVRIQGTLFENRADAQGAFRFNVVYRTPNCIIPLVSGADTLFVLVDSCAPGVLERGNWSGSVQYYSGDLVQRAGSTWYALRANKNKLPGAVGTSLDWSLFAARGPVGPRGPAGLPGDDGPPGAHLRRLFVTG